MKRWFGRFSALILAAALLLTACSDQEIAENQQNQAESQTVEQQ